jgi:hypothetical protein
VKTSTETFVIADPDIDFEHAGEVGDNLRLVFSISS